MLQGLSRYLPGKFELLGWTLLGVGVACISRQAEIDYAARHVWEEAERIQKIDLTKIDPED
jgi:hypothetical protein